MIAHLKRTWKLQVAHLFAYCGLAWLLVPEWYGAALIGFCVEWGQRKYDVRGSVYDPDKWLDMVKKNLSSVQALDWMIAGAIFAVINGRI